MPWPVNKNKNNHCHRRAAINKKNNQRLLLNLEKHLNFSSTVIENQGKQVNQRN